MDQRSSGLFEVLAIIINIFLELHQVVGHQKESQEVFVTIPHHHGDHDDGDNR